MEGADVIYDITREIREDMTVYKDRDVKRPHIEKTVTHEEKGMQESKFHIESHTGTHIDAPLHMIKDGDTVLDISPEAFISEAQVLDLTDIEDSISQEDLQQYDIEKDTFILLKTKNSFDTAFNYDFVYLDVSGAQFLVSKGVRGVGIDALGVERSQQGHPTHKTLLKEGVLIIEGLDLKHVEEGEYELFFAPLKIKADASPIRAWLRG